MASNKALLNEINQLDISFQKLSADFYRSSTNTSGKQLRHTNNIRQLHKIVSDLIKKSDEHNAIQLLYYNQQLVLDNVDSSAIFPFIRLLLKNNEWNLAEKIFSVIKEDGEKSLLANANFIFAKYYADRHDWEKASRLLNGIFSELPADDATYAYLLKGVALQNLKDHRGAITYYKKIPSTSRYYREAQLNIAVASIRQGWWTDANTIIRKVTTNVSAKTHDETINRLHLVLGYALLQREYYRNARNEFRHITLDSRYANRALLGIGLTATNQGDYVGGLNALSILKKKNTLDLSVDESYLLLPYVYEKLQQEVTVSASYSEAMNYYQKRIRTLEDISAKHVFFLPKNYDDETSSLIVENNSLDYISLYPESFIKNYRLLLKLSKNSGNSRLSSRSRSLLNNYDNTYQEIVKTLLERRISYLKSYLNQSRYGLARFFDSSQEESNNEKK